MPELWAWMNGERVGRWHRGRTGRHRFTYEESWLASPKCRPLSLSLPIGPTRIVEGQRVAHYFDNLLPDSDTIRKRLAIRFKIGSTESFELLQAIGRDCVGAVQLLPPEELPVGFDRLAYRPLTEAEVEHHLLRVPGEPAFGIHEAREDFRISLGGAQEKTALLRVGDQWCEPQGATPTTHILKLPLGLVGGRQLDLTHSIENEWLCGRILAELGLPVAASEMAVFGHQKALVVERFDRQPMAGWIARLPQEDFCQVFGQAPTTKYEKDGGPGMADILKVLAHSETADADIRVFLKAQLAFWLLAATDGHAKNFSLFLLPGMAYRLTPLYDVLSAWPVIGHGANKLPLQKVGMAMALHAKNVHYRLNEMQPRHWRQLARQSGVEGAWMALLNMVEIADQALDRVVRRLPAGFPLHTAQAIFEGVRRQRALFLQASDE